jgi:pimeloyl-ACP methyl ester carboxylesterase
VTLTLPTTALEFNEPAGLNPRGTLIVLTGRGESAGVYERFGRRISADSWRVRVLDTTLDVSGTNGSIDALLADSSLPSPRVLVGSDAGAAAAALYVAANPTAVDGVVLVGLPNSTDQVASGGEDTLRSACPVHRRTLDDPSLIEPGALVRGLPEELAVPSASAVIAPVLAIHGDADPVVPQEDAVEFYRSLPNAEIVSVRGGRHDVLNDLSHRSVAATVVLFLERIKAGGVIVEPLV